MATFHYPKTSANMRIPSPATALNDLNSAALANDAAQNGGNNTVEGLTSAINRLKDSGLPANINQVAQYRKQLAALQNNLFDDWYTKGNLDAAFKNSTAILGKKYAMNPKQLLDNLYQLYEYHATQLEQHINDLGADGKPVTGLSAYGAQISDQAAGLEKLIDDLGGAKSPQGNFGNPAAQADAAQMGFAIQTDGNGKITSLSLEPFTKADPNSMPLKDSQGNTLGTAIRTSATYGGVPAFIVPQTDPANPSAGYTAKIGNLTFTGQVAKNGSSQAPLEIQDNRGPVRSSIDKVGDVLEEGMGMAPNAAGENRPFERPLGKGMPVTGIADRINTSVAKNGGPPAQKTFNNMVDLQGHITPQDFSDMTSLPIGSTWTDATGKYYFMNDDGTLMSAPNAKVLANNLNKSVQQVQQSAQFLNSKDLETVQSQQNPYLRSQNWLTDPSQTSPLQSSGGPGPTSMGTSGMQPQIVASNPPGQGSPAQMPTTTGKTPGIKIAGGPELQQNNTQNIAQGAKGLPNAMQQPANA